MAIEMQTQLVKEYPDESEYRAALAVTQHQLGHMLRHADEATAAFTVSSELLKELNEETPQNMVYVKQLAHNYSHLGRLLYDVGKTEEAHETYRASVQLIGEPGSPADADVVDTHHAILGGTYRNWGVLLRDTERLQKAETAHRNAVRLFGELVQDFPSVIYYHKEMGLSQLELGRTLAAAGRHAEAKEAFEAAHHVFSELDKSFPDNPVYERGQERAQELLGIRVETTEPEGIQPGKDNRP
jgi:tetratricopeptide (TPR) repeat protein